MGKEPASDAWQTLRQESSDSLQEKLYRTVDRWESKADNPPVTVETLSEQPILRLQAHNYNLWNYESEVRNHRGNPERVADLKKHIDEANKARNQAIQHIDEELEFHLASTIFWDEDTDTAEDYELNSQTVGQMLDRLSVLVLKKFYTQNELDKPTTTGSRAEECRRRIAHFEEQSKYIQHCLDQFINKLEAGKAKMKPYEEMKFYEETDLQRGSPE